jgi:glycosyltransferase involved in cell wall biosynthesis
MESLMVIPRKVLLISSDDFSGVRPALMTALQQAGLEVIYRRQSLRELGIGRFAFVFLMIANALLVYGKRARFMRERTWAAYFTKSLINTRLVNRYPADWVILIAANSGFQHKRLQRRPVLTTYTDYANLLSKALPQRGFKLVELEPYARWNEMERDAFNTPDRVFVMGQHVKPAIASAYRIAGEKLTVAGAGPGLDVDIERDAAIKPPGNRNILFVGKLGEVKGVQVLLRAFAIVRESVPDAHLTVITNEPVAAAPGVTWQGRVVDTGALKKLFYDAAVFTMPAYKEPLGLVFLEAMWSKCACVGTLTGSMPEIIREGVTGHLVEPGDHAALAGRLIELLQNPEATRAMGERGYVAAKEYWSWPATVQRMLSAIKE